MAQYPASATSKLAVTKSGSAGDSVLPTTLAPVALTTDIAGRTYGAWGQVVASSAADYVITAVYADTAESTHTTPWYVDLGTGGAGSETVKGTVLFGILSGGSWNSAGVQKLAVPVRVPAGTRIAARAAVNVTAGGTKAINVVLLVTPYSNLEGN